MLGKYGVRKTWATLVVQWYRIYLQMQETWVQSLGQGMETHSSILAWEIPWREEPGRLKSMGGKEPDRTTWALSTHVRLKLRLLFTASLTNAGSKRLLSWGQKRPTDGLCTLWRRKENGKVLRDLLCFKNTIL